MTNWNTKDWLIAAGIGSAGILLGVLFSRRKSRRSLPVYEREGARYPILPPTSRLGSLERMEPGSEIPRERHCDCEIRLLKSKGGSTRYAAVCPSTPIPRYVKKEFAERMQGKKFCIDDLLKPFSSLSGRWAADRRWGPYHREAAKHGAYK